jgi:hypothetical protein
MTPPKTPRAPGESQMSVDGREHSAAVLTATPARTPRARRAKTAALIAGVTAVLFFCYWRQSESVSLSSDGSGNVLQAWDMLHGNLLLHRWWVSDVSFSTTELPQYMLIEAVAGGLGVWVVHVAAAMTYTLLVLLGALLAKGRAPGPAGLSRALLAAGLMLAPQLSATGIVLLSPDHTGTAVPLLAIWLLIDRAKPRWFVPLLVGLMVAWVMTADSIVLLTCVIPLVLVAVVRAVGPKLIRRGARPAGRRYELALAGAVAAGGVAGLFAPRAIAALGGYQEWPVGTSTAFSHVQHGSWVTLQAFLEFFGANVVGMSFAGATPVIEVVFVALHLAGVIAVVWALGLAFARFFRAEDLIVPVFAAAVVLTVGAFMVSAHAQSLQDAREMGEVLPLGAVLAGRVLGEKVPAWIRAARTWLVPVLAVLAAGYLAALGYGASQPAARPANQPLAAWLLAHRFTDGLAGYWQANSTTVDSGGRVVISSVQLGPDGGLVPYRWETDEANYDPAGHDANFVVAGGPAGLQGGAAAATLTFGAPARTYHVDGYTVMVWNTNLLPKLGQPQLRLPVLRLHVQSAAPGHHQQGGYGDGRDRAEVTPG